MMANKLDRLTSLRRSPWLFAAASAAVLSLVVCRDALAGTLTGVVRDAGGGVLVGATVRVVGEAGRPALEVVTDQQGSYRVASLAAGKYRVEAALSGFDE